VLALCLAAGAKAQLPDELTGALSASRLRGCAGQRGIAAGLHSIPQLTGAAQHIARGEAPAEAAKRAGYRSVRLAVVNMSGYGSAARVAQAMAEKHCKTLTDPELIDFGFHRQGDSYWMILAAPFTPPPASAAAAVAERVLALTNEARSRSRQCGPQSFGAAAPVASNPQLARAAALHAQDMAQHSYLEHEGRDGSTAADRVTRVGYRWRSVGENIASGQTTPERVMREWLLSPGHCANVMNPVFTEMGLAYAVNLDSAEGIYWAQVFGRPR